MPESPRMPPGRYGGDEVQALFTNRLDASAHPYFEQLRGLQVSAHFYVRRTGELWQFVSCDDRAWHAGASSWRGRANCNDHSIGIDLEGLEGDRFEAAQCEALAALCSALAQHYPIDAVAGHEHIAPGRKLDPGLGFDWARLQRSLGWPESALPTARRRRPRFFSIGTAAGRADPQHDRARRRMPPIQQPRGLRVRRRPQSPRSAGRARVKQPRCAWHCDRAHDGFAQHAFLS